MVLEITSGPTWGHPIPKPPQRMQRCPYCRCAYAVGASHFCRDLTLIFPASRYYPRGLVIKGK